MNKTVQTLLKQRRIAFICVCVLSFFLSILSAVVGFPQIDNLLATLFFGMALFAAVYLYFGNQIGKRLIYLSAILMDPNLLENEVRLAIPNTSTSPKQKFARCYYDALCSCLEGDFNKALITTEQMPTPAKRYEDIKNSSIMLLHIYTGKPDIAKEYLGYIMELKRSDTKMESSSNRVLGTYFVETGDYHQARYYLEQALSGANYPLEVMGLHYNLARLDEKEGNFDEAMKHYQQAAQIGPKTWMGQESARRAAALGVEITNKAAYRFCVYQ